MTKLIFQNTGRFFLLILLQVLVLNNVEIHAFIVPHLYVLFILLLPFETPKWLLLPLSFLLGLSIDLFLYVPGIHAAACTLMGFLRPLVYSLITSKQEYEPGLKPGIRNFGFRWFLSYSFILITAHHLVIYALDEFRFALTTLLYFAVNVIFTTLAVILAELVFYRIRK